MIERYYKTFGFFSLLIFDDIWPYLVEHWYINIINDIRTYIYIYTHTPLDTFDAFLLGFRHNFMNRSIHQSIKPTMQNHDYWCSTFGDPQVGWVWTKSRRTSWSSLKHLVNNGRSDLSTINGCRVSAIHSSFKILIGLPSGLRESRCRMICFLAVGPEERWQSDVSQECGKPFCSPCHRNWRICNTVDGKKSGLPLSLAGFQQLSGLPWIPSNVLRLRWFQVESVGEPEPSKFELMVTQMYLDCSEKDWKLFKALPLARNVVPGGEQYLCVWTWPSFVLIMCSTLVWKWPIDMLGLLLSLPRRDVWQGVVLAVRVGKMEVGRSGGRGLWLAWSTRNMLNTLKMESFLKQLLSHWMDYQSTGIHKTPLRQHMVLWWKQNRPIATDLEFRAWHHSNCWLDTMLVIECTW